MYDIKFIQERIDIIFDNELDNLRTNISFKYVKKCESVPKSESFCKSPRRKDLEAKPSDNFYLKWDTYATLKQLYNAIEKDSKSRETFIYIIKEKLLNGETIPRNSNDLLSNNHDTSSLAFYFLLSIGRNKDNIEMIVKRFKNGNLFVEGLFSDIVQFMHYESFYFDDSILMDLKKLNSKSIYFAGSSLKNIIDIKINSIRYNKLQKELEGVNQEINFHKEQIIEIISKFRFSPKLGQFLLGIDKTSELPDWESINSGMISNLRAFFEELTTNIAEHIKQITNKEYPKNPNKGKMGNLRDYIKNILKLSDSDDKLVDAFVDILHKEGGHAFLSEKRYFLLTKNIGIEIAYFLLSKLEDLSEGKLH